VLLLLLLLLPKRPRCLSVRPDGGGEEFHAQLHVDGCEFLMEHAGGAHGCDSRGAALLWPRPRYAHCTPNASPRDAQHNPVHAHPCTHPTQSPSRTWSAATCACRAPRTRRGTRGRCSPLTASHTQVCARVRVRVSLRVVWRGQCMCAALHPPATASARPCFPSPLTCPPLHRPCPRTPRDRVLLITSSQAP
jgi:hypothetical protein